ncbi:MAG: response regulator [Candidatus Omnitrophica bacterium]|nr:response regulator [Candidatus Omnitrophota bacterium]
MNRIFKVLIIEDEDITRKMLSKSIRKEGFEVFEAENGRKGLEMFKEKNPEIIITDIKMPEMSGIEVMETVKKISPEAQVILVTAFGKAETAIRALHAGAIDYIKKPIDLDQLSVALGRAKEKIMKLEQIKFQPVILLVDDDKDIMINMVKILEKEQLTVRQAEGPEQAIDTFNREKIDIMITDLKMSKMNGIELIRELRNISDDFKSIIVTGYGDENEVIEAIREETVSFIKKPINCDQLLDIIGKAVDLLQIERALKYRERELKITKEYYDTVQGESAGTRSKDVEKS